MKILNVPNAPTKASAAWVQVAALTTVSAFCLCVVGGWFGSQLIPPILKSRRDRGLGRWAW